MNYISRNFILLLLSLQFFCLSIFAVDKKIRITTNSPVRAGEKLIVNIAVSPQTEEAKYRFNGETHIVSSPLKIYKAYSYANRYTKLKKDADSYFNQVVIATSKYQSIVSIKLPDDNQTYSIWGRAKGGPLCLRNQVKGKSKELKWNWQHSKAYSWRFFGNYNKNQLGNSIAFMNSNAPNLPAIDCILLTTDKGYMPSKQKFPPNIFCLQTDASLVGKHKMPITLQIDGKIIRRNITIEVLPPSNHQLQPTVDVNLEKSVINIPLGKSALSAEKYEDFNIFNQNYKKFFSKKRFGIKFPTQTKFIALKCKKYPEMPSEVNIAVGKKLSGLAFLHTEYWQGEVGQKVAFYRIEYNDSTSLNIPLREEFEIAGSLRPSKLQNAIEVFEASSKIIDFHVSLFVWKNPHPEKQIKNIVFSNRLSRYSKEENKIIPLNVTSMSSQILLKIIGIKNTKAMNSLLAASKSKSDEIPQQSYATVDFNKTQGKISPFLFSTNETDIMNFSTSEFDDYRKKMSGTGCQMFRLHSGWSPEMVYPKGIKGPKLYKKLTEGIRSILKDHPERVIMICLNRIPKYINPQKQEDREHFAALAVDLMKHFKKENIPVKYWEIYNEVYFDGVKKDRSLWTMYNLTAKKLKGVDSEVKIGGYAPCWPTISGLRDFYEHCNRNVDFISWHKYPTGSSKTPDSYIMDSANTFGKDVAAIKKVIQEITPGKKIEYALTEYNINYNWKPHDPRQANNKGAVWLASVLYHLIKNKADIALTWHSRSGGTFGLISHSGEIRPSAQLLYLCNHYLKTSYVASKSSNKNLECLGFVNDRQHIGILVINKSHEKKSINVSSLNLPDLPQSYFEGNAKEYTINAKGLSLQKTTLKRNMKLTLAPYSLKMIVCHLTVQK